MKKALELLFKLGVLIFLSLFRLGELNLNWVYRQSKYRHTLEYYLFTVVGITIFLLLLDFVKVFVVWFYRRRNKVRGEDNFIIGIGHIYSLVLVIGLIVSFLSLFQINVRELFTSLSIVFAGLALLTKDYVSNMINGMILTFSGNLSIGDNVRINDHRGKIIDITLQNIHLLNDDDDVILIPNNMILTSEVTNYTKREVKRTSVEFEVDIHAFDSVETLEHQLIDALKPFHDNIRENSYYLRVAEVRKDLVVMKFQYILKEPNKELERLIRRKAVRHLVKLLHDKK